LQKIKNKGNHPLPSPRYLKHVKGGVGYCLFNIVHRLGIFGNESTQFGFFFFGNTRGIPFCNAWISDLGKKTRCLTPLVIGM
jgi:hypothetical protein